MSEPLQSSPKDLHVTHEFANESEATSLEDADLRSRVAQTAQFSPAVESEPQVDANSPAMTEDFRPDIAVTSDFQTDETEQPAGEEADESIDDYMARLLNRVNNGVDAALSVESLKTPVKPTKVEQPIDSPVDAEVVDNEPEESLTVEVRLPKRAPENRDGLLSMRRLANATAHDALRTHNCRQLTTRLYAMLALIVGALTISCFLAIISPGVFSFRFGVAVVAMIYGTVGIWRYSTLAKQLLASSQAVASIPEAQVAEPTS